MLWSGLFGIIVVLVKYCIVENFGKIFNLVIWRIFQKSPILKLNLNFMHVHL